MINVVVYLVGNPVMKFAVNLVDYLVTTFGGPLLVIHLVGHLDKLIPMGQQK